MIFISYLSGIFILFIYFTSFVELLHLEVKSHVLSIGILIIGLSLITSYTIYLTPSLYTVRGISILSNLYFAKLLYFCIVFVLVILPYINLFVCVVKPIRALYDIYFDTFKSLITLYKKYTFTPLSGHITLFMVNREVSRLLFCGTNGVRGSFNINI